MDVNNNTDINTANNEKFAPRGRPYQNSFHSISHHQFPIGSTKPGSTQASPSGNSASTTSKYRIAASPCNQTQNKTKTNEEVTAPSTNVVTLSLSKLALNFNTLSKKRINQRSFINFPHSIVAPSFSNPIDFSSGPDKIDNEATFSASPETPCSSKIEPIATWNLIEDQLQTTSDQDQPTPSDDNSSESDMQLSPSMDYYFTDNASPHPHFEEGKENEDENKNEIENENKNQVEIIDVDTKKLNFSDVVITNAICCKSQIKSFPPDPFGNNSAVKPITPSTVEPIIPSTVQQTAYNKYDMVAPMRQNKMPQMPRYKQGITSPVSHYGQSNITSSGQIAPQQMYNNINNNNMNNYVHHQIPRNNRDRVHRIQEIQTLKSILQSRPSLQQMIHDDVIRTLIFDQDGSRYIQSLIKNPKTNQIDSEGLSLLIQYLVLWHKNRKLDLAMLSCDQYGNYAIQLALKLSNDLQLTLLLNTFIYHSVDTMSESRHGCRVVINTLNVLLRRKKDLLFKLLKYFKNKICQRCPKYDFSYYLDNKMNEYSAIVIQNILGLNLPYHSIKFIGDALERNLSRFCGGIYGSRIVQRYISFYGAELNVLKLFDAKDSYFKLSKSVYGNYTIQKILKKDEIYSNLMMYNKFRNNFISNIFTDGKKLADLSVNKHGSALIETCIKVATREQIGKFVQISCTNNALILSKILYGEFGNFVARSLLRACVDRNFESEGQFIVNSVNRSIINLNNCAVYGQQHVDAKGLSKCTSFIKECCHWYHHHGH